MNTLLWVLLSLYIMIFVGRKVSEYYLNKKLEKLRMEQEAHKSLETSDFDQLWLLCLLHLVMIRGGESNGLEENIDW